jgi:Spermidine/putrescine-binding periplasmic protein
VFYMGFPARLVAGFLLVLVVAMSLHLPIGFGEERVVRVYNYSEYIDRSVLQDFERETGIRVVYDEFEAAEEAWAKLSGGGGGYDVIVLAHTHVRLAIERGLVRALDKSLIPNIANLDPLIASHPADPKQDYAIPYMWGVTGIAYDSRCVESPPETWRELLDPKLLERYKGRVTLLPEFTDVVEATMIALGYDIADRGNWNERVMREVIEHLRRIKGYLRGFWGASEYMPALARGELCLAQAWNGDVLVVAEENPEVGFVTPRDGAYFWVDFLVIPRDARNVREAHAFIDFLLRPDVAARNVKATYYTSSVKKSLLEEVAERGGDEELKAILENPLAYPPEDVKLIPSPVLDEEMLRLVTMVHTEVMAETPWTLLAVIALALIAVLLVAFYIVRRRIP